MLVAVLGVLVLIAIVLGVGYVPRVEDPLRQLARMLPMRYGPAASLLLLYLEESGIPVPVPGDVYVAYLGHVADSPLKWVGAWLGVITVVLGGASNLYLISRRWGRGLVRGRLGAAVHLSPRRLAIAEGWFARWGALAIIFGRHIPGFRVPITVAVGIFGVPYRTFALGVAVSTAVWAAFWLWVGAHFGARIGHFLVGHRWTYAIVGLVVLILIASVVTRLVRAQPHSPSEES